MKTLAIAKDLKLPLDVVTQTIAILAKRRAGKSYTMRRLVEQLFKAGQQVVLVDPKGDQWGVRFAADGKAEGLPIIILGGERGDVKLEAGAGEVVAKLVVEERVSVVLDLSLFRKHEVATFMTAFMENLYRLKAREVYRTPVMLVIDEADAIAPQKPQKGEERMLGAAEDIVRRGGQRGIGCVLVSQRSAVLNKNVLTQAQMLVVLRTIAPQDLAAMKAWIDVHGDEEQGRTLMASLPSLDIGDAWFWSPGWPTAAGLFQRSRVLPIETFDSGKSPEPGAKPVEPKKAADVDLKALQRQMAATIEKQKADDPRELKKQLAELRRQVDARKAAVETLPAGRNSTPEVRAKVIEKKIIGPKEVARLELVAKRLEQLGDKFAPALELARGMSATAADLLTEIQKTAGDVRQMLAPVPAAPPAATRAPAVPPIRAAAPVQSRPRAPIAPPADGITPKGQQILDALAELKTLGAAAPRRNLVALMAGYTNLTSKGFVNAMSALSSSGYITYPSTGQVQLTEAGDMVATAVDAPRDASEVQARVIQILGGKTAEILKPIIAAYPEAIERPTVAGIAGYTNLTSKGFVNAMSRLSSLGFVTYPSTGLVKASPVLFLEE